MNLNPKTDLVLERYAEVEPSVIWRAWTEPEHVKQWFTPKPWTTPECDIDLRPGGKFRTLMRGPEGDEFDNTGCYLEIVENQRLVWTTALLGDYRPTAEAPPFHFTAIVTLRARDGGTDYRVVLMHSDEKGASQHKETGFHDGWGTSFDQLVEYMKTVS